MTLTEGLLQELEQKAQTTRRVLERVPNDQLEWRPHPKARTLGELAMHVAIVPGAVAEMIGLTGWKLEQESGPLLVHRELTLWR